MAQTATLVTLLPATDSDLGRWMLQHWGIDYVEKPHAPVFHILALKKLGFDKFDFPLLIDGDEKTARVQFLWEKFDPQAAPEKRLVPDPDREEALHTDIMEFQHRVRMEMGTDVVRWAYFHFLQHKDLVWPSFTTGVPWMEKAALSVGFGRVRALMYKSLKLDAAVAAASLDAIRTEFDRIDTMLEDGRKFLFADRLTLADLAFAAMGAPMVLARGYGGYLPDLEACPEEIATVAKEFRARPSGLFVQRIYDEYRQ